MIEISQREDLETEATFFAKDAKSANTQRAYAADWRDFVEYLAKLRHSAMPASPDDVANYLRSLAGKRRLKMATVQRRLAAISEHHKAASFPTPTDSWVVKNTLRRLRREYGVPARGKAPLVTQDLRKIVELIPDTLAGTRDKALLLLGFSGAMRRSELVMLNVEDLAIAPEGLVLHIKRSKTDQNGLGRKIGIPHGCSPTTCPVRALNEWLRASKIVEGALFRGVNKHGHVGATALSDQIVADIVKKYAAAIGKQRARFSGHSLRVGFITSAAIAGASERKIQDQSGHQSLMILRRYIREASVFRFNAATKVGL